MQFAIKEFIFNLKRSIFLKFKEHYHKMCQFKAKQAMRIAYNFIHAWREVAGYQARTKQKMRSFNYRLTVDKYRGIVQQWHQYAQYCLILRTSKAQFLIKTTIQMKTDILAQLRANSKKQ